MALSPVDLYLWTDESTYPPHLLRQLRYKSTDKPVGRELYDLHNHLMATGYYVRVKTDLLAAAITEGLPPSAVVLEVRNQTSVIIADPDELTKPIALDRAKFLETYEVD